MKKTILAGIAALMTSCSSGLDGDYALTIKDADRGVHYRVSFEQQEEGPLVAERSS